MRWHHRQAFPQLNFQKHFQQSDTNNEHVLIQLGPGKPQQACAYRGKDNVPETNTLMLQAKTAADLSRQLGPGLKICILGSTSFSGASRQMPVDAFIFQFMEVSCTYWFWVCFKFKPSLLPLYNSRCCLVSGDLYLLCRLHTFTAGCTKPLLLIRLALAHKLKHTHNFMC